MNLRRSKGKGKKMGKKGKVTKKKIGKKGRRSKGTKRREKRSLGVVGSAWGRSHGDVGTRLEDLIER